MRHFSAHICHDDVFRKEHLREPWLFWVVSSFRNTTKPMFFFHLAVQCTVPARGIPQAQGCRNVPLTFVPVPVRFDKNLPRVGLSPIARQRGRSAPRFFDSKDTQVSDHVLQR
jgi:hypothetical protein